MLFRFVDLNPRKNTELSDVNELCQVPLALQLYGLTCVEMLFKLHSLN